MARNASFKVLMAHQVSERFVALFLPQEKAEWRAANLKMDSEIEDGLGKSNLPNLGEWQQTEPDGSGEIPTPE